MSTCLEPLDKATHRALDTASLSEEQAEAIYEQGKEAVVFALLDLTKQLAEAQGTTDPSISPSTPSGMIPTYKNPPAKGGLRCAADQQVFVPPAAETAEEQCLWISEWERTFRQLVDML